ncbi:MAG: preprotein translocase subunit SecE [Mycobacteriales bacterium]|nr:preprotein translocase subunit SecE [Frankia sp.]
MSTTTTTTTPAAPKPAPAAGGRGGRAPGRPGRLSRIALFYREVVAELRKVIWPTRHELISYTAIVLVFVIGFILILAALDFAFTKGVLAVFG